MAGAGGIEPPNDGIKIRCLTAWRRPMLGQVIGRVARRVKGQECLGLGNRLAEAVPRGTLAKGDFLFQDSPPRRLGLRAGRLTNILSGSRACRGASPDRCGLSDRGVRFIPADVTIGAPNRREQ